MKILVVDDKQENIDPLTSLLEGNGYEVVSAENGKIALEILKSEDISLIISDILMPIMDGYQFCHYVKNDDSLLSIPFIFYSATYTDKKDKDVALDMGADRFIEKPTEPEKFIEIIRDVIKESEEGKLISIPKKDMKSEGEVFKLYNERLIKKLEKKMLDLEKAEILYRAVFECTGTATLVVSEDLTIEMANQEVLDMTGYKPGELIGRKWIDFVAPESLEKMLEYRKLRRSDPENAPRKYETKLINKSGQIRSALLEVGIIPGTSQSVVSILDITERKKIEEEL